MVIKNVSRGEPITALWANSLVNEVNLNQGIRLRGRNVNESSGSRIQMASEPAFQIRFTKNGYVTLNAGQIYVNGYLVTQTVEEGQNAKHSYNQFSSIKNWDKYAIHQMTNGAEDLPEWYILITSPKNVTESNINEVEAELVKKTKGQAKPTKPENIGDDKLWACVQISKVVDNQLLQLVSGSIYISSQNGGSIDINPISLVAGDGIKLTFTTDPDACKIEQNLSVISSDNSILIAQDAGPDNIHTITLSINSDIFRDKISIISVDDFITINDDFVDGVRVVELSLSSSILGDGVSLDLESGSYISTTKTDKGWKISNTWDGFRSIIPNDFIIAEETEYRGVIIGVDSTILQDYISHIVCDKLSIISGDKLSFIAGDGIEFSEVDGDGIVIQLANVGSTINLDGLVTYKGNYRTWDTIDSGAMGVDLTQFTVGSNNYMLRAEIERTDKGNFLKFSI